MEIHVSTCRECQLRLATTDSYRTLQQKCWDHHIDYAITTFGRFVVLEWPVAISLELRAEIMALVEDANAACTKIPV
jgi:hypothetical protein